MNSEYHDIVKFTRQKDYELVKELGAGACGKTVLLYDPQINEHFVCKKYSPYSETVKESLFKNFLHEIKLLHQINHSNIVRVFNYFVYPENHLGYIVMEHINGTDIASYVSQYPENINHIFSQSVKGFCYLEENKILHRDIRPQNLLVNENGILKIIDFGFGKQIHTSTDFNKSITLNWWCEPPEDFSEGSYSYSTEVYFLGKLFEKLILENKVEHFGYKTLLKKMCSPKSENRIPSFTDLAKEMLTGRFDGIPFSEEEISTYRSFSIYLVDSFSKIESKTTYIHEVEKIEASIEDLYRNTMLEEFLPHNVALCRCFTGGAYFYQKSNEVPVSTVKSFLDLLRVSSKEKKNIIIRNIHSKLDSIKRYDEPTSDEIPF